MEFPDSNGSSRAKILRAALKAYKQTRRDTSEIEAELEGPQIPDHVLYLWNMFWDIRSGLKTDDPLNTTEFLSYMTVFEEELDYQERRLILDLDRTFQREVAEKQAEERRKQQNKAQKK